MAANEGKIQKSKRSLFSEWGPSHNVHTGFTPQKKKHASSLEADKAKAQEVLEKHFQYDEGSSVKREDLMKVLTDHNLGHITGKLLWTPLHALFGSSVKPHGKERSFANISHKEINDENLDPKLNVLMEVSTDEATALQLARDGSDLLVVLPLLYGDSWKSLLTTAITNLTKGEVKDYCVKNNNILRKVEVDELLAFDLQKANEEFLLNLPILTTILQNSLYSRRLTKKDISNGLTTVTAKYLGLSSNKMSAYRKVFSSLLVSGGTKADTIDMLAKSYDTMSYSSVLEHQNALADCYLGKIQSWQATDKHYSIVFDNLDKYIRARHQTAKHQNKMVNMVQAIAYESRVKPPLEIYQLQAPLKQSIKLDSLLPSSVDLEAITWDLALQLRTIISESVPALAWLKPTKSHLSHKYSSILSKTTEQINLGLLKKNENTHADIVQLMTIYNSHAKSSGKTLLVGDWLSFKRAQAGLESVQNGKSCDEKRSRLLPVMADFHSQMELCKLIFKALYDTTSSRDVGSLFACRNVVNARNVTAESKNFYANEEFVDSVTKAYSILAALEYFGLENEDDTSVKCNVPQVDREATAQRYALDMIAKYTKLSLASGQSSQQQIKCRYCNNSFLTMANLKRHCSRKHQNTDAFHPAGLTGQDMRNTYATILLTLGLSKMHHQQCISWGNGPKLMVFYRLMLVWCKALGLNNYAVGLLELQYQLQVLPPCLAHDVTWNRCVNHLQKPYTNHALDLALEHANGQVKSMLASYRGEFTDKHLARISRGSDLRVEIRKHHAACLHHKSHSGRHRGRDRLTDTKILVAELKDEKLFEVIPGRTYTVCHVNDSILHVAPNILKEWTARYVNLWQNKPYYCE